MPFSLIGGLIGAGKKPKVPGLPEVDAQKEQAKAISGNLAVTGALSDLAKATGAAGQAALDESIDSVLPGFRKTFADATEGFKQELKGELPKDVVDFVQRTSAERGVFGGFAGSQFGRNLEARDLGLQSLQIRQQALSNIQGFIETARRNLIAPQLDVTSMFLSPGQQLTHSVNERDTRFNRDLLAAGIKAQASPMRQAIGAGIAAIPGEIADIASAVSGFKTG